MMKHTLPISLIIISLSILPVWRVHAAMNRCQELLRSPVVSTPTVPLAPSKLLLSASKPASTGLSMSAKEEFEYLTWRHRSGYRPEKIKQDLPRIIELAEKLLKDQGIQSERVYSDVDNYGQVLTLVIVGDPKSPSLLSQMAYQLAQSHFGLKLVYNPFTLLQFVGNAYFSPKHNQLGLPHEMVTQATPNLSFYHELIHAGHFVQRQKGTDSIFFGVMKLLEGPYFIAENPQLYPKLMTFEELNTNAYTLMETAKIILKFMNESPLADADIRENPFFRDHIISLEASLRTTHLLSLQSVRVLESALQGLGKEKPHLHFSETGIAAHPQGPQHRILSAKLTFEMIDRSPSKVSTTAQVRRLVELDFPLVAERHIKAHQLKDVGFLKNDLQSRTNTLLVKAKLLNTHLGDWSGLIPKNFADVIEYDQIDIERLRQQLYKLAQDLSSYYEPPQ